MVVDDAMNDLFPGQTESDSQPVAAEKPSDGASVGETTPKGKDDKANLDVDAIRQVIQDTVRSTLGEFGKSQQSQRDKQEARITRMVQERLEELKGAGIQVTQAQTDAIRQQIANKPAPEETPITPQPIQAQPKVSKEAIEQAKQIIKESGAPLQGNSPEARIIDRSKGDEVFLESVRVAVEAATLRANQASQASQARISTIGGGSRTGNPLANIKDIDTLYAMARRR